MREALIRRIPLSRGSTYRCIVNQYTEYITHKYRYTVVVFYVYGSTNTKDMTHQRRSKGNADTTVLFTGDTPVTLKKDQFLAFIHIPYHQCQEQPNITVCKYLQVQEWKGSADGLLQTEWGWQQLCDDGCVPLQTALAPAPENLLRIIRCSYLNDCSTLHVQKTQH